MDGSVAVWRLPTCTTPRAGTLINLLRLSWHVRRMYTRGEVDLLEAPDYQGPSALLPSSIPCIVRLHSSKLVLRLHRGWQARVERIAMRRAWGLVAVSRWMALECARLLGIRGSDIDVIPNLVDPVFQPGPGILSVECHRVVFAGTLSPHKGLGELMRAWPRVLDAVPEATLWLFGKDRAEPASGRCHSEILQELLPPSCRHTVRWEGPVEATQLRDAYRGAQVCVFPSLYEAFGLVAAEAMACGRPVVFTRNGPGGEVVEHGITGLLCDPANSEELAGAIVTLLRDRQLAARMGEAALRRVEERFALPVVLRRNLELYSSVLQNQAAVCRSVIRNAREGEPSGN
jgi:glycosyltransferase involved in cell wall biosynthesis